MNSNLGFIVATPPHHPHGSHAHQHHNNSSNNSMSQSYHPHSIFYGQQYHRIQPQQQSFCVNQQMAPLPPQPPPLRLTDSFEQLSVIQRHSGSSFSLYKTFLFVTHNTLKIKFCVPFVKINFSICVRLLVIQSNN